MYRVILASLLLLMSAPAITVAQAPADTKTAAAPAPTVVDEYSMSISGWQRFVSMFSVALLVIIVIQLMLLRADLSAVLERQVPPGGTVR